MPSFQIDTKWGGDIYSVTKWFGDYSGITERTVQDNLRETGVIAEGIDVNTGEPNTIAVDPEYWFGDYWGKTEPAVIDGTYVKLREISLGYDVKFKTAFISNLNIGIYSAGTLQFSIVIRATISGSTLKPATVQEPQQ